ncbi:SOS response-associated peptidase [Nocardiopsis mangrovi]|uniref:Abasic site processing protein n=1 Tax=Nocardiopsis mangrovi TaxID=1179818 RepID=A0ABV9DS46_9ACTN
MCGRYVSARNDRELRLLFDVAERVGERSAPSWNVAPTDTVRIVLDDAHKDRPPARQLRDVRWGLLPVWAEDRRSGARMINARSETITEKPAFRSAAARRRCVVPADGYYEWQKSRDRTTPFYLHAPDESVLPFAGLYERWPDPDVAEHDPAKWVWTCTILTRPATDTHGHIHDRAPVILPLAMVGDWLDTATTRPGAVRALVDAIPEAHLVPRRVDPAVGSVRTDEPWLIDPVD